MIFLAGSYSGAHPVDSSGNDLPWFHLYKATKELRQEKEKKKKDKNIDNDYLLLFSFWLKCQESVLVI